MIRIGVCDDAAGELDDTCRLLKKYFILKKEQDASVDRFSSVHDLLDHIDTGGGYDVYLLDVLMPGVNGIELGMEIRRHDERAVIIYLTNSADHAVESYRVRAADYLLKPLKENIFFPALDRALAENRREREGAFPVKSTKGITVVYPGKLMYVRAHNRSYRFYLADGSVLESGMRREPFEEVLAPLLKAEGFVRCMASSLVNLKYAVNLSKEGFVMRDGAKLPISRGKQSEMKRLFMDYLLRS